MSFLIFLLAILVAMFIARLLEVVGYIALAVVVGLIVRNLIRDYRYFERSKKYEDQNHS